MNQAIKYALTFGLSFVLVHAQEQPAPVNSSIGEIPAGFENLNNDYYGSASIYLGRDELGQANIDFKDVSDLLILSKEAQQMVVDKAQEKLTPEGLKQLKSQLKKPLPANSRLQNFYQARSNEKVSIYYDYKSLEAFVFIPNKYFKEQEAFYKHAQYLMPDKDINYQPSLRSGIVYEYEKYNQKPYYWQTDGALSSGPFSFVYDANSGLDDYFNDFHLEYFDKKYIYSAGYLYSQHDNMLAPSGNIWGVSAVTSTRMMNPRFYRAYQTPFSLYLDNTYEVTISLRGKKLFSEVLPMGENIIDTSNFPPGRYSLDIEKKDLISGTVTKDTEMYYGARGQYNSFYSGFEVYAGYESKNFGVASSERKPYVRVTNGYNFWDGEVDVSYIHGQDINFLGAEYNFLSVDTLDYGVSAYFSQYFDWYFGGDMTYRDGPYQYRAFVRNGYQDNDYQEGRQRSAGGSISYTEKSWRFYLNGTFQDTDDYTLSTSVAKAHQWYGYPVNFNLSNSYDGKEITALFSVSVALKRDAFSSGFSLSQNDRGVTQASLKADYVKPNYFVRQRYTQTTDKQSNDSYYADVGYQSSYGEVEANAYFAKEDSAFKPTSKGYAVKTNMLLTPSAISFSKDRFTQGFLVSLPYIDDGKDHIFTVDNKEYSHGENVFLRKSEFSEASVLVGLLSPEYSLKYNTDTHFFFPNNVFTIHPELSKSCFISFTVNLPSEGFYTIVGREDEVFGISGEVTTFQLNEGEKILIKDLTDDSICDTGVTASCNSNHDELGQLRCKTITKPSGESIVPVALQPKSDAQEQKSSDDTILGLDKKEVETVKHVIEQQAKAPGSVKMYLAYKLLHHRHT